MSLEGKLDDLGISDIFQILNLSRRTGTLTIRGKEGKGLIVFNHGQVVYASVEDKKRLGSYLLESGVLSGESLENALSIQKISSPRKLLGHILLGLNVITEEQIEDAIKKQIKDVIGELLACTSGSFSFELEDYSKIDIKIGDPEAVFLKNGLSTQFLLLESARLRDEEKNVNVKSDDIFQKDEENEENIGKPALGPSAVGKESRKDLSLLTSMIEELAGSSGTGEATLMVLRFASEIMNRAVVFIVAKDTVRGLGQFGLNFLNGSADEKVRSIQIPLAEASIIKEVIEKRFSYKGEITHGKWNDYLMNELGGAYPLEAFISPLVCGGRVIAVLYGDNLPGKNKIEDTEGLEAFMRVAGVALEKAVLEKKLKEMKSVN